jgi:myo-inositol-1(or 4)-monophosphatase
VLQACDNGGMSDSNGIPLSSARLFGIRDLVVPAVVAAGRFVRAQAALRHQDESAFEVNTKQDPTDYVTAVDLEVEARISAMLESKFPDFGVLGEEGSSRKVDARHVWVLDPLDGTRNFVMDHAGYCVSLGLVEERQTVLGVIYDIAADELYTAVRHCGAYLNGRRIGVSHTRELALSTVGIGFTPWARSQAELVDAYIELLQGTAALRQSGAAARDLAYVARGSLDAFWQPDLKQWDLAAGMLLVEEAGGQVLPLHGGKDWFDAPQLGVIAGNAAVLEAVKEVVAG